MASVAQLFVFHHTNSQPSFVHVYSERFKVAPLTTSIFHVVVELHQFALNVTELIVGFLKQRTLKVLPRWL